MRWAIVAVGLAAGVSGAQAQQGFVYADQQQLGFFDRSPRQGTPVDTQNTYLDGAAPLPGVTNSIGQQVYSREFVRLSDVIAASSGLSPDAVTSQHLSTALVGIAARLDRLNARLSEGIALAGSFNVLPPNPGDRFAISVGGAGYNGAAAASITASARIDESTVIYGGVARGPTQTMVKGGVGWSFR